MRVFLIVLDSLGIGSAHDASLFDDADNLNTLLHATENKVVSHEYPNLWKLGLFDLAQSDVQFGGISLGAKLIEKSKAKDTVTGHWEMMGVITEYPLPTFPDGLPADLINQVQETINAGTLGNEIASGTEIINRLGEEHLRTGKPILYTSADSVLQIAAHEDIISPNDLHQICFKVRQRFMEGPYAVSRIIARPFEGNIVSGFKRTTRRKDFALPIPEQNVLNDLSKEGIPLTAIGKIKNIFTNVDFDYSYPGANNKEVYSSLREIIKAKEVNNGLIFANLVDFDSEFGHRRNAIGYGQALKEFDVFIAEFMNQITRNDVVVLTADHGCDPKGAGTDHTRENVPFLLWQKQYSSTFYNPEYQGSYLGFSHLGETILDLFNISSNMYAPISLLRG